LKTDKAKEVGGGYRAMGYEVKPVETVILESGFNVK
jgi:hypothetical protein